MIHSALSHTALDFTLRCLTQHRMSSRDVAHSAIWHPVLSHTAQDFNLHCLRQGRIKTVCLYDSSRVIAHSVGCHPALSHIAQSSNLFTANKVEIYLWAGSRTGGGPGGGAWGMGWGRRFTQKIVLSCTHGCGFERPHFFGWGLFTGLNQAYNDIFLRVLVKKLLN